MIWITMGLLLVFQPLLLVFQKYGEITMETMTRWRADLTLDQMIKLMIVRDLAVFMIIYGLFSFVAMRF